MGKQSKRRYTLEFKQQSLGLANRIGAKQAADHLGVNVANIHRWKSESKETEVQGEEKSKSELAEENKKLQKENAELKKVNHILKAAAAFFSQDHLK